MANCGAWFKSRVSEVTTVSPGASPRSTSISETEAAPSSTKTRTASLAVHQVQGAAGGVEVRAALEFQHVVALIQHDAYRGALVLAQSRRLAILELDAAGHLVLAHLGGDRGDESRGMSRPSRVIAAAMPGLISPA